MQTSQPEQDALANGAHREGLIFLRCYLEERKQLDLLSDYRKTLNRVDLDDQLDHALSAALWALKDLIAEDLRQLCIRGQLLFCFDGATVLTEVAA